MTYLALEVEEEDCGGHDRHFVGYGLEGMRRGEKINCESWM